MVPQSVRSHFARILKIIILLILAAAPLGAAFAAAPQRNVLQQAPASVGAKPLSGNPTSGAFSPLLVTGTFSYSGPAVAIPDNDPTGGVCVDIPVSQTGVITGVRLTSVGVTHTYVGDLRYRLYHPDGTTYLTVMDRPGRTGSGPGFGANPSGAAPIQFFDSSTNDAEFMGGLPAEDHVICADDGMCDYFPNRDEDAGSLVNFAGFNGLAANGTWQFCAYDLAVNDTGTVDAVTLEISSNNAPTDIALSNNSVAENSATGTLVGNLTTTDDLGDTHTYNLQTGVLGCDDSGNGSFQISGAQLQTNAVFDYETPPTSRNICVRTTDNGGLTFDKQFTVNVTDVDEIPPTVAITSSATSPTNTSPIPVTITFSESVTGFLASEITVVNGTAGNFAGSGAVYTADITPTAAGLVTVNVAAGVAKDLAGNDNTAAPQFSITYDSVAPTVAITSSATNPTATSPIPVTITFSESVTGFLASEITVVNGTAGNFAGSGAVYTADITPTAAGLVTVNVAAGVAKDLAGNDNTAAPQFSITYDPDAPTLVITSSATNPTTTSPIPVTFTFNESVTGFALGDITVGNGTAGSFVPVSGTVYTANITPAAAGLVTVNVAAGVAIDGGGTGNIAAPQFSITYSVGLAITGNAGTAGAILSYTDGTPKTVTADGSGNYTINILSGWSGTVTPSKAGYTFSPVNRTYTNVMSAQSGQNYTASAHATFGDVPTSYWSWQFIETLAKNGVTAGCGSGNYCPLAVVTRDQMAVFLLRGEHGGSYVPPAVGGTTGFGDVLTSHWAAAWIKQLAAEGITAGCGGGYYCPGYAVTRDQMAVFLLRAKHGSSYVPPAATGVFQDVPTSYWAAAWIEQLAKEGVTTGCSVTPKNYCPSSWVTRDQMAVFLVRAFSLLP